MSDKKLVPYASVNNQWPDGPLPKLTPQEAISAAKRLWRKASGKAWKGKWELTSGNRYTWPRYGVYRVNPDKGWHDLVHDISHYAHRRMNPSKAPHHFTHAWIERGLIKYVVGQGWLEGKLRRERAPKPSTDIRAVRRERVLARIKAWEAKRQRADNALKKLRRQAAYYADSRLTV